MGGARDISNPVEIRALRLITPRQFGILLGHGETTVEKWIAKGWVRPFTALDTVSRLIRIEEVERFLADREQEELRRREEVKAGVQALRSLTKHGAQRRASKRANAG